MVPVEQMVAKVGAAIAARQNEETFIIARTDAIEPEGVESAIRRAEAYFKAGADGVYVEGPRSLDELERVGRALSGAPLATSLMERGGVTPWLPPQGFADLGYKMVLYPTSLLFALVRALETSLQALRTGEPLDPAASIDLKRFEEIVELSAWARIEDRFSEAGANAAPFKL